jgi:3-hydroxyacyl-[acyl-carrier-protein] dehydratase
VSAIREAFLAGVEILAPAAPGAAAGRFRLDPGFPAFRGHFPGRPVLPAVVQVLLAQLLIERVTGAPARLVRIATGKFRRLATPGMTLEITCRPLDEPGSYDARIGSDNQAVSSFVLHLAPRGDR